MLINRKSNKTVSKSLGVSAKQAFTMAEILIAMTILGVIALMTIPQILGNTGGRSNKLMIQKSYAVLSQNLKIAFAKMDFDTSDADRISSYTESGSTPTPLAKQKSLENLLIKTMDIEKLDATSHPFLSTKMWKLVTDSSTNTSILKEVSHSGTTLTVGSDSDDGDKGAIFKSRDGVYYIFPDKNNMSDYGCSIKSPCLVYIDVNGLDAPNTLMRCDTDSDTAFWNQLAEQFQKKGSTAVVDPSTGDPVLDPDGEPLYENVNVAACTFDALNTADIFAVLIYGGTVVPASNVDDLVLNDRN